MRKMASYIKIILSFAILLSLSGAYATWKYALDDVNDVSIESPLDLGEFTFPLFTVTYMIGDIIYLEDHHYDASKDYIVIGAPDGYTNFKQWVNPNGIVVTSIPKNNTNNYTLYATWLNKYTINFIDTNGNLIYSEEFVEGTSKLSKEGQNIVDKWLENENLKTIGSYAREDLEKFFGVKVYLNLWVKVKENWRDDLFNLNNFGYNQKEI